jgi:pantoate--beta-alanine ligase
MPTLRVIGTGRAGSSVDRALRRAGWTTLPPLRHGDDLSGAAEGCDVLVVAVPDAAVAEVAGQIRPSDGTLVVHLAGSLAPDVLADHPRRAAVHPVVALPDGQIGARRLEGAWYAVAGDPQALDLVEALGGRPFPLADEDRPAHHAACAIAANHTTALLGVVERLAARAGLPLAPYVELAAGAVEAVAVRGPAGALTGPVARGDWATVRAHLAALPEADRPSYLVLAAEAARLAGRVLPAGLAVPPGTALLHEKAALRKALDHARAAGLTVGLVPTMGALHDGHLALVRRAAAECDVVAVTIFVNPLQFDRADDLAAYPRTLEADVAMAAGTGATLVFAPTVAEMYGPDGARARVHVEGLADRLEGASRPGHFDGVATVCTKLFGMAGPCRAYFGEKDFQQVAVVRRLVADLDLPVEIVPCPIVRADDGLALSSRNALLTDDERAVAPALHRALRVGAFLVSEGERDPERIAAAVRAEVVREPRFRLDRVDVVDADTLAPPGEHTHRLRILAAAFLGQARLIDNLGAEL